MVDGHFIYFNRLIYVFALLDDTTSAIGYVWGFDDGAFLRDSFEALATMDDWPAGAWDLFSFEAGLRQCLMDYATLACYLGFRLKRCIFRDDIRGFGQILSYFFEGSIGYTMGGLLDGALLAIGRGIISGADGCL